MTGHVFMQHCCIIKFCSNDEILSKSLWKYEQQAKEPEEFFFTYHVKPSKTVLRNFEKLISSDLLHRLKNSSWFSLTKPMLQIFKKSTCRTQIGSPKTTDFTDIQENTMISRRWQFISLVEYVAITVHISLSYTAFSATIISMQTVQILMYFQWASVPRFFFFSVLFNCFHLIILYLFSILWLIPPIYLLLGTWKTLSKE